MTNNKTILLKELEFANATTFQAKAAFILHKVDGIEKALEYVGRVKRRNMRKEL